MGPETLHTPEPSSDLAGWRGRKRSVFEHGTAKLARRDSVDNGKEHRDSNMCVLELGLQPTVATDEAILDLFLPQALKQSHDHAVRW